ncbi:guanine nucleotide-binding protein-like 3 homolog [Cataglyphis hispanica]|uniref:guanine nucleotide-binding protein-like 3 homolog n=1 Tax=Cataglyphis hispanica TaxID=1086592 RepID=UPI0021803CCC|nr:guanine nucleotide-binding protein-like 3 homolog [Cataglyphis hispanica]
MKLRNKPSKRMPARKRYKIEKKVRDHNRKIKKQAKHSKKKSKMMQIPNQCPFKEDILKEIEAMRKQQQEEKQKQKEAAREKKQLAKSDLKGLVNQAQNKQLAHESMQVDSARDQIKNAITKEENSLKAYYKEFKKVLDAADIILEIMDARDPLGTRCKEVEEAVKSANKRLVLVLNKADLIPRENLDQWLKYLRVSLPAVAFKSSTQNQAKRLGRRKLGKKTESMIQSNTCFGAELLLSLLGNYCRNSDNVKTSITVGVVGLPNVGKSSVINSLKRNKACNVGNVPGITKTMQVVQLDSKIKLLDSPGIVFATSDEKSDDMSVALKNAVKIQALKDPFTPATAILKRVSRQQIMELYNMQEFSTPDEFFAMKAARMGKYRKGGVPDARAAARSILEDWNSGKIRYYTVPPEQPVCHISAEIVSQIAKEFDIESFAAEEKMMLDNFTTDSSNNPTIANPVLIDSSGPVTSAMEIEIQKESEFKVQKKLKKKLQDTKKDVSAERKKKPDPLFEIEGNQKLNKLRKLEFKKEKKERAKREKATAKLAGQLEDVKFTSDDYDFDADFTAT